MARVNSGKDKSLTYTILIMLFFLIIPIIIAVGTQTNIFNLASVSQNSIGNLNTSAELANSINKDGTMGPLTWEGNASNSLVTSRIGSLKLDLRCEDEDEVDETTPSTEPIDESGGDESEVLPPNGKKIKPNGPKKLKVTLPSEGDESSEPSTAPKKLKNITSLILTISKVEVHIAYLGIHGKKGGMIDPTPAITKPFDHWETLDIEGPVDVDVVQMSSPEILGLLGVTELATGKYTEIRLYIDSATATFANGTVVKPEVKGKDRIVRVVRPFTILPTEETVLTLVVDAEKSVIRNGKGYTLKPVIARFSTNH